MKYSPLRVYSGDFTVDSERNQAPALNPNFLRSSQKCG